MHDLVTEICTRFPYLLAAWRDVEHSLGLEAVFKGLLDYGLHSTHVFVRRIGAGTNKAVFDLKSGKRILLEGTSKIKLSRTNSKLFFSW